MAELVQIGQVLSIPKMYIVDMTKYGDGVGELETLEGLEWHPAWSARLDASIYVPYLFRRLHVTTSTILTTQAKQPLFTKG